jgi:spore germination protein
MKQAFLLFIFVCMFSQVNAQTSVLREINTTLSPAEKKQKIIDSVKIDSLPLVDTLSLNDSLLKVRKELDSLKLATQPKIDPIQSVSLIDTVKFQKRIIESRKPLTQNRRASEADWAKEFKISNKVRYNKKHLLDTAFQVFGWHPYWMGNAHESYNYSLLSYISYFSYEVNPQTGFYNSIYNWRKTTLVDSAKKYNCKVLLTITNFGSKENRELLSSTKAKKNLISTAITLIRERQAHGLTIDFENVPSDMKVQYTNFLIALSSAMKTENEEYVLSVALPAVDFQHIYDFAQIDKYVDLYVVMGYEYYGINSAVAGPVAPLTNGNKWSSFTLENSVKDYLASGITSKKMIMALPYYGVEWVTQDLRIPSIAKSFIKYYSYSQAKALTKNKAGDIDFESNSKFYAYSDRALNYRQLWFEDSATLAAKYDWIKSQNIGGVGIWALGYDNGHEELWKLLANKFAYSDEEVEKIERSKNNLSFKKIMMWVKRLIKNPKSVITKPKAFLRLFGALAGISFIGLFVIIRYSHKFKRLFKLVLQGGIAGIIIMTLALIFIFLKYFEFRELLFLIGGFAIGLILFFAFTRRYISEKDLP